MSQNSNGNSIFGEMHPYRHIGSWQEFDEIKRMLADAINRRLVEEVPVINRWEIPADENWVSGKEDRNYLLADTPGATGPGQTQVDVGPAH